MKICVQHGTDWEAGCMACDASRENASFTYCPGCDTRIFPGQGVIGVDVELWHVGCRRVRLAKNGSQ